MKSTNIVLKDGQMQLANWSQNFQAPPTVGDMLEIPGQFTGQLSGYGTRATVSKVVLNPDHGIHQIEAEAACELEDSKRPVVFLNASLLPEDLRGEVEQYLRSQLELPILNWEESRETQPILRLHPNQSRMETSIAALQAELRRRIRENEPAGLVTIR